MGALYKGFIVTAIISLILLYPITSNVIGLDNTFNVGDKSFTGLIYTIVELLDWP